MVDVSFIFLFCGGNDKEKSVKFFLKLVGSNVMMMFKFFEKNLFNFEIKCLLCVNVEN